ncbi:MAG: polyprenyl synthetase family protein [Bacillota bacterium]|nr:polyprenyl synthetase family protein [Bacillota bacterium]
MEEFNEWISYRKNLINKEMELFLEKRNNFQSIIYNAINYSIFAGGKRIRPILTLASYELFDYDILVPMPFACAIEMIHTYSLIHDDLPAMDDDDYRRGNPSCHKKFGEDIAILAGDALLNKAYEIIFNINNDKNISPEKIIEAGRVLAYASGSEGMIGGQIVDLHHEKDTLEILEYMHLHKTGALINASCKVGGIIGGADEEELVHLDEFSKNLGLAFQVKDDILDVEGKNEDIGKPSGSDIENKKLTYVTLLGVEKAKKLEKELTEKSISSLDYFGSNGDCLKNLANTLLHRKN